MTRQAQSGPAPYLPLREGGWRWQVGQVVPRVHMRDWSRWYLTDEEDMGQHELHCVIVMLLADILGVWAQQRPDLGPVYQDVFFGWLEDEPLVRVSPDVFALPRQPDRAKVGQVRVGRPEHLAPAVAFEIVSEDWKKDYEDNPLKYELMGAEALVVFDPAAVGAEVRGSRVPLQVFERVDGHLTLTASGPGPHWCQRLGAAVLSVQTDQGPMLRLARDREGQDLVPSRGELAAELAAQNAELVAQNARIADAAEQRVDAANQRAAAAAQRAAASDERAAAEARRAADLEARLQELLKQQDG